MVKGFTLFIRLFYEPSTILGILHVFPLQVLKGIGCFSKGYMAWGGKDQNISVNPYNIFPMISKPRTSPG